MKFTMLSLLTLSFSSALFGCGQVQENAKLDRQAEIARNTVGIQDAQSMWKCAGKANAGSNEYYAATVQQDKRKNFVLTVSQVVVSDGRGTQTPLLSQVVAPNKLNPSINKEYYYVTTPKSEVEVLVVSAADPVGAYDYDSSEALIPSIKPRGLPLQIDCKNSVVK